MIRPPHVEIWWLHATRMAWARLAWMQWIDEGGAREPDSELDSEEAVEFEVEDSVASPYRIPDLYECPSCQWRTSHLEQATRKFNPFRCVHCGGWLRARRG